MKGIFLLNLQLFFSFENITYKKSTNRNENSKYKYSEKNIEKIFFTVSHNAATKIKVQNTSINIIYRYFHWKLCAGFSAIFYI